MIAWIGSIALAICGVPLAISTIRKGEDNTNIWFLVLWTIGELGLAYSYYHDNALMFNYVINIVSLSIVWIYRLKGWYGFNHPDSLEKLLNKSELNLNSCNVSLSNSGGIRLDNLELSNSDVVELKEYLNYWYSADE